MENLKFILRENVDRWGPGGELLPDKVSTLGFKFNENGEEYGSYFVICKPTVKASDIIEILPDVFNEAIRLCNEIREQKRKHGTWKKRGNSRCCSECGFIYYSNNDDFNFCPNCGDVKNMEVIRKNVKQVNRID